MVRLVSSLLSRWLPCLLGLLLLSGSLGAATSVTLSVDNPAPVVGSTITVTLGLNGAGTFANWGCQVDYPTTGLQLVSQGAGTFGIFIPDARPLAAIQASGEVRTGGMSSTAGLIDNGGGSGSLLVLTFRVIAAGNWSITTAAKATAKPSAMRCSTRPSPRRCRQSPLRW